MRKVNGDRDQSFHSGSEVNNLPGIQEILETWAYSPGQEDSLNPLQYSCLENPMDRGACQATVHGGHRESDATEETENACMHAYMRF